ncbi:thioesterase II family protein [Nonomuraea basaltis]|uniref:thioesterase II family protein n=1 Tax=Nonomuraea basaltis TaxID=2495887 RepID=UPI00110C63F2|nr:thioesterase domain-containing protein [Nonomuraea basaltis]TMR99662.1 thioesterase [Nonomuraea basaltis]
MQDCDRRWLKRFGRSAPAEVQLLCFHHAGGSAAMYRHWPRLMPHFVEPIAVQLPGRADRFAEPPYDRMAPLVDELIEMIKPLLDRPFACYGVSMGARVAWALAHELRERAMPMPSMMFVAASASPCFDDGTWAWEGRDDGLEGYVREMGGTPAEVLAEPELLAGLLPTLDADLTVLSTHGFRPLTPLEVPIRAFAGTEDPEAPPEQMDGWRAETSVRFDLDPVPGGHFFDSDGEHQVIRAISHDLA